MLYRITYTKGGRHYEIEVNYSDGWDAVQHVRRIHDSGASQVGLEKIPTQRTEDQ